MLAHLGGAVVPVLLEDNLLLHEVGFDVSLGPPHILLLDIVPPILESLIVCPFQPLARLILVVLFEYDHITDGLVEFVFVVARGCSRLFQTV